MNSISLPCLRGNAVLSFTDKPDQWSRPYVLTGKRKRPDTLHWTLLGEREGVKMAVGIQGLYRGSYADAIAEAGELYKALVTLGAVKEAGELAAACAANDIHFNAV